MISNSSLLGFQELGPAGENPNARMYPSPEEMKNASPGKPRGAMPPVPMPQGAFGENPFVPRNMHPLYRFVYHLPYLPMIY